MSGSEWPPFEQLSDVPGFTVPVHRALTEPILLAGAPRAFAILNGTLAGAIGLGLQLWVVGNWSSAFWAICSRGLGRPARSALRRGRTPASAASRSSRGLRTSAHDEPRGISPERDAAGGLPALGGAGRPRRGAEQGWQPAALGPVPRARSRQRGRGGTRRRGGAHQQRFAPPRFGLGDLRRGAARAGGRLSRQPLSRSGLGASRCRAPRRVRRAGGAFPVRLFPDLPLPAARRRGRAGRDLALRRPRQDRHRCGRSAARLHRPHRPGAGALRRHHARMPLDG